MTVAKSSASAWDVGIHRGFLYSGGQLTPLVVPGATRARPVGINERGDVLLEGAQRQGTVRVRGLHLQQRHLQQHRHARRALDVPFLQSTTAVR